MSQPDGTGTDIVPCTFKKILKRRATIRKKDNESDIEGDEPKIFKTRRHRDTLIGAVVKGNWSSKKGMDVSIDEPKLLAEFSMKSSRSINPSLPRDMGSASHIETETPFENDGQAIIERSLLLNKELKNKAEDKIYRGINGYQQFFEREDKVSGNAASGHARSKGPMRAPLNIRVTTRWDYQPDVCKDYKETGFCGFGDNCKFLHDRTEYKFGWEMEGEKISKLEDEHRYEIGSSNGSGDDVDDDDLPTKCSYCREQFRCPVKTKCDHYFCEKCALAHYEKTSRCLTCGEETEGKFRPAKDLLIAIERKQNCTKQTKYEEDDFPSFNE